MAKTITGKRVIFELEFYWRGKRKIPSVNMTFASDNYNGLPESITNSEEYKEFHKAANSFCKKLVEEKELD